MQPRDNHKNYLKKELRSLKSKMFGRLFAVVSVVALAGALPLGAASASSRSAATPVHLPKGVITPSHKLAPLNKVQKEALARNANQRVIILFKNQAKSLKGRSHRMLATRSRTFAAIQRPVLRELKQVHASKIRAFSLINAIGAKVSQKELRYLRADPAVSAVVHDMVLHLPQARHPEPLAKSARRNSVIQTCGKDTDDAASDWQLQPQALGLTKDAFKNPKKPQAQNYDTGKGVTVAFMADGVDIFNPDFIRPDGTTVFSDYEDFSGSGAFAPTGGGEAFGDASSIAAQGTQTYNVNAFVNYNVPAHKNKACPQIKILGMAPDASLMGLVVFNSQGSAFTTSFIQAIQYAVANGANIINQSFGGNPYPDTATDPITLANNQATADGVTVVASTGDAGTNGTNGSPSTDAGVIAVGATTQLQLYKQIDYQGFQLSNGHYLNNNISSFSSGGVTQAGDKTIDVVAPGDLGWALCDASIYNYFDCSNENGLPSPIEAFGGTSESAPITAGEAALVIQAYRSTHLDASNKEITPSPAIVKQIIMNSATDLNLPSYEQGAGLINALKAVRMAASYGTPNNPANTPPTRHGDAIGVSTNSCSQSTSFCNLALTATGNPGTRQSFPVTVSNYGVHTETITPSIRKLSPTPVSQGSDVIKMDPATFPTFISPGGAPRPYTTRTFNVASGAQRLKAAVSWNIGKTSNSIVYLILLDPNGAYADYSIPQGLGNGYGQVEIHDPMPGTWKAIIATRPVGTPGSYDGYVQLSWTASAFTSAGDVTPSSATLSPGQSTTFTVHTAQPSSPGDLNADVVINGTTAKGHQVSAGVVPVVLRALIPTDSSGGTFSGILNGGNGRPSSGNEQVYAFRVPHGVSDVDLGINLDPKQRFDNLEGVLLNPQGLPVDIQSNITQFDSNGNPNKFTPNLQFFRRDPVPGVWRLVLLVNYYSGPLTSATFTGNVTFNGVNITSSGVPDSPSTTVTPSSGTQATITITNTGNTTKSYFVDPRLTNYVTISLGAGIVQTDPGADAVFLVPPATRGILFTAERFSLAGNPNEPVNTEAVNLAGAPPVGISGTPDVMGSSFVKSNGNQASQVNYTAPEVPYGLWAEFVTNINGPYFFDSAPPEDVYVAGLANTQQFDDDVTTTTGDIYGLFLGQTGGGYTPLTLDPGQTGTITVSFNPSASDTGNVVNGHLYIETLQVASGFSTTNFSGDEVKAIPYSYTVGS